MQGSHVTPIDSIEYGDKGGVNSPVHGVDRRIL